MVESIRELRRICRMQDRDYNPTFPTKQYLHYGIYIVKVLLYTSLTANQVSVIGAILGAMAGIFFLSSNVLWFIPAFILIQLWRVFDCCDGSVARYRKTLGRLGTFFDWLESRIPPLVIFPCIGLGLYLQTDNVLWMLVSAVATLGWFFIYIFGHVKVILHKLRRMDKGMEKRIKKNKSNLVALGINILKRMAKTFKTDKIDMYEAIKNKLWENALDFFGFVWMPLIMSTGIAFSIIFGFNSMGVILSFYAVVYTILWVSGMIFMRR